MCCENEQKPESPSRRNFFANVSVLLGGIVTSLLGRNGGRYFISPAWQTRKGNWAEVASLASLPKGTPVSLNYIQRKMDGWMAVESVNSVWILAEGEEVIAFNPKCTHLGCPFSWDADKEQFLCPCHTGIFSKTGEVISGPPPRPLDRYPIKIDNGMVMILPELKGEEEI